MSTSVCGEGLTPQLLHRTNTAPIAAPATANPTLSFAPAGAPLPAPPVDVADDAALPAADVPDAKTELSGPVPTAEDRADAPELKALGTPTE
jgi:hypothetical protein